MTTHTYEPAPIFAGQVCPDCDYPYAGLRVCSNPVCYVGNPNLRDSTRQMLADRVATYRAEQEARRKAQRLYAQSFRGSRGAAPLAVVVLYASALVSACGLVTLPGPGDVPTGPTIGGEPIPAHLQCEEDEAVTYAPTDPAPRSLRCVHLDDLR